MKPERWQDLPGTLLEPLLWDCELEYDVYEDSKAGCVHDIMNGSNVYRNQKIIDTAWKFMSEDSFKLRCEQARDGLKEQLSRVEELLDNNRRFV